MPTAILLMKKLKGEEVKVAARHNLRQSEREIALKPYIDQSKSANNVILSGGGTSEAVIADADAQIKAAGIEKLRKDAVRGVELVVSVVGGTQKTSIALFEKTLQWSKEFFKAPILSAVVHFDEPKHHLHIILLPLIDGRMVGSDLVGYKPRYREVEADFDRNVLSPLRMSSGARREPYKSRERNEATKRAIEALRANPKLMDEPAVKQVLRNALGSHIDALEKSIGMYRAGVADAPLRSFAEIWAQPMDESGAPVQKRPRARRAVTVH